MEKHLTESEHQYRTLVELSPSAVVVYEAATHEIMFANTSAVKIIGATTYFDLLGHKVYDFVHKDDLPMVRERVKRMIMTNETAPPVVERFIGLDGETIFVEATGRPIKYKGIESIMVVFNDVSEKLKLENQLRHSSKIESLGRLTGGIAHDFNNILTVVLSNAENILNSTDNKNPVYAEINKIYTAAKQAETLIRQLLAISQTQTMKVIPLDLNRVIGEQKEFLSRTLPEDIELIFDLLSESSCIMADPAQIEQVILNMAINAQDAMPQGGQLTIKTEKLGDNNNFVLLSICDTGKGMSKESLEKVFEPFFTTKINGSGLGLSIVYGIINQLGGKIFVETELGEGTDFYIRLPICKQTPVLMQSELKNGICLEGAEKILLVEDNKYVRETIKDSLEKYGYEVTESANANKALKIFKPKYFDLIITDVVMPKMNGVEMFLTIKKTDPDIKVLFMSGYPYDITSQKGILDLPPATYHYVQKPVTPINLLTKIKYILIN